MKKSWSPAGGLCVKMSGEFKAMVITPENYVYDVEADWETRKIHFNTLCGYASLSKASDNTFSHPTYPLLQNQPLRHHRWSN